MSSIFLSPFAFALGTAIFHSLWIGALTGLALLLLMLFIPRRMPGLRYLAGVAAVAVMVTAPTVLFFSAWSGTPDTMMFEGETNTAGITSSATPYNISTLQDAEASSGWIDSLRESALRNAPLIAVLWLAGMLFFSLRLIGGYVMAERLRSRGIKTPEPRWQFRLNQLAARLRVGQPVELLESLRIHSPVVIGWLKPTILMPAGMLAGFTPEQLDMIFAHELAHVRRHDYFVNLLLSVAEALLFFHPAMWFASKLIRQERENACDAIALSVSPDKQQYARVLLQLSEYKEGALAMSASGGQLTERIRRILNLRGGRRPAGAIVALLTGTALIASLAVNAQLHQNETPPAEPDYYASLDSVTISASADNVSIRYGVSGGDTTEIVIRRTRNGQVTEIRVGENNEITSVTENGVAVPADRFGEYEGYVAETLADSHARLFMPPMPPLTSLQGLTPVPPVPPAPMARKGESDEEFEARLRAWEQEMEVWEEQMEQWEPGVPGDHERQLEAAMMDFSRLIGDSARWEEFALHMQALSEQMSGRLGKQLERLGDEEMWEKFGEDMEKWGEKFGKDMEKWGEDMERLMELRALEMERSGAPDDLDIPGVPPVPSIPSAPDDQEEQLEDLGRDLEEDGLSQSDEIFKIKIENGEMTVNGKKLSREEMRKYSRKYPLVLDGDHNFILIDKKKNVTRVEIR